MIKKAWDALDLH